MRTVSILLLVALLLVGCTQSSSNSPVEWERKETDRFVVYYPQGHDVAAADVLQALEDNYQRIVDNLEPSHNRPYTVRLYPSLKQFHQAINQPSAPSWAVGTAWGDSEMRMVSPKNPGPVHNYSGIIEVAVHEFAHCVTFRLAGNNANPQSYIWLWESIALYEAGQFSHPSSFDYMRNGSYPKFLDVQNQIQNPEIYNIGYTVMEFLVDNYGYEAVRQLVKEKGDVTGVLDLSREDFYEQWYAFVKDKYLSP